MTDKIKTSFMLTREGKGIIKEMAEQMGVSQSGIVELAVRSFHRNWTAPLDLESLRAFATWVLDEERGEDDAPSFD